MSSRRRANPDSSASSLSAADARAIAQENLKSLQEAAERSRQAAVDAEKALQAAAEAERQAALEEERLEAERLLKEAAEEKEREMERERQLEAKKAANAKKAEAKKALEVKKKSGQGKGGAKKAVEEADVGPIKKGAQGAKQKRGSTAGPVWKQGDDLAEAGEREPGTSYFAFQVTLLINCRILRRRGRSAGSW